MGSYARPAGFWIAQEATQRGELGEDDVNKVMDEAVEVALRDQEEAGIDIVSDSEMRRAGGSRNCR